MDRNTIIGIVLIFLIIIGMGYLNSPSKEEKEEMQRKSDSLARVRLETEKQNRAFELEAQKADSIQRKKQEVQLGSFATALSGEEKFITLENDLMKVQVSNLGGKIYSVELKNYKAYNGQPLVMFAGNENVFGLQFWGNNNDIQTNKLFFTPDVKETELLAINEGDSSKLTMRLSLADSSYIDYIYTIKHGSYLLNYDVKFFGMNSIINGKLGSIDLLWDVTLPQLEKGAENESNYTTISYMYPNLEYEEIAARSDETKEITTKIKWIAYKQQFFSSILVSDDAFLNSEFKSSVIKDGVNLKKFSSRISIPFVDGKDETLGFQFFFGPNHFNTLKKYELGFEKVVPLGKWIIRWINKFVVIPVFDFLDNSIASYGLIILILTILIKVVLLPLTYKSYLSSAKMRVLKPQVDEVNAKFPKKEDAMKKQQAVMALYRKVGVNPLGGCIPILIQFPILIAMFRFFPASIELRQQSFLWADDLSSYDSIVNLPFSIPLYGDHISLFTLLMAAALFVTSKMNTDQMGDTNAQMPGMKFMMTYLMPIMMVVWFNSYSSGLSYYYFLSNLFTIGQTYLIRRFVDDEAILAKLHENAKKPVKKSKFQQKLEEIAKRQQDMQKKRK